VVALSAAFFRPDFRCFSPFSANPWAWFLPWFLRTPRFLPWKRPIVSLCFFSSEPREFQGSFPFQSRAIWERRLVDLFCKLPHLPRSRPRVPLPPMVTSTFFLFRDFRARRVSPSSWSGRFEFRPPPSWMNRLLLTSSSSNPGSRSTPPAKIVPSSPWIFFLSLQSETGGPLFKVGLFQLQL